jgi:hypothetical protein
MTVWTLKVSQQQALHLFGSVKPTASKTRWSKQKTN